MDTCYTPDGIAASLWFWLLDILVDAAVASHKLLKCSMLLLPIRLRILGLFWLGNNKLDITYQHHYALALYRHAYVPHFGSSQGLLVALNIFVEFISIILFWPSSFAKEVVGTA